MTSRPAREPFTRKAIQAAPKAWHNVQTRGEHPLATLTLVAARRATAGYPDTPGGRGVALREVLQETLTTLRPKDGQPDPNAPDWRPYLIIDRRYLHGRSGHAVAEYLGV